MKIEDVHVTNWQPPGEPFWDDVKSRADEPLIEATIKLTLSWNEYAAMLKKDKIARGISVPCEPCCDLT